MCGVSGQEERHQEVQGHVHRAEHHEGQNRARDGRTERKPPSGSSRSRPNFTLKRQFSRQQLFIRYKHKKKLTKKLVLPTKSLFKTQIFTF